jgi:hypothetical protein
MMRDIKKRPIDWLWKPFIQRRALNVLSGDPGVGKSTVVCEIVAALSSGRGLPGQGPLPPMTCWIMNGEDAADDTITWRLDNQGANPDRVMITDVAEALTARVIAEIKADVIRHGVGLLVIDPLQAWMGAGVDMHRANETRNWSAPLRQMAMDCDCAVMINRHRRKAAAGDSKLYSGLGSIDITGFTRSELSATRDKHGGTYIERIKGTVGVTGEIVGYVIEPSPEPGNDHGVLRWLERFAPTAHTAPTTPSTTPKGLTAAVEWIRAFLRDGPRAASDVLAAALAAGLSERTLKRAKEDAGAVSVQIEKNVWVWQLGGAG